VSLPIRHPIGGPVGPVAVESRRRQAAPTMSGMTTGQLPGSVPASRASVAQRRRVALLLETADVLAERARRTDDALLAQVLLRRSAQRRAQAARLVAGGRPVPAAVRRRQPGRGQPGGAAPEG
jgi:hypothetical protein